MAAGLQIFDGAGRLILNTEDPILQFSSYHYFRVGRTQSSVFISVPGLYPGDPRVIAILPQWMLMQSTVVSGGVQVYTGWSSQYPIAEDMYFSITILRI